MRKIIQISAFVYGCLATLGVLMWHVGTLFGDVRFPRNALLITTGFIVHGIMSVITLHEIPVRPYWEPLIRVASGRIRMARICLGFVIANFVVYLLLLCVYPFAMDGPIGERLGFLFLTSFLLVNTTYIVVHWALRPENLFSARFREIISNPLYFFFISIRTHMHGHKTKKTK